MRPDRGDMRPTQAGGLDTLQHSSSAELTGMFREAAESAAVVEMQLKRNRDLARSLAAELKGRPKKAVVTLARGSSDHAATYARYLIETRLGILTSSAAPSVVSLYASGSHLRDTIVLAISQSGQSPDLLASATAARAAGAYLVALVNAEDSPLGRIAHSLVPLCAGEESSVAATKSFIASTAAILQLVACWSNEPDVLAALELLPSQLKRAWELDWSAAQARFHDADSLYVLGRGLGLGIAGEAALKFKETCGLHAEAFSAAELHHGPMAIVRKGFPVFVFAQQDETCDGMVRLVRELEAHGAEVTTVGLREPGDGALPFVDALPAIAPLLQIQSFYRMVNALAVDRGLDPDRPRHLSKVTETM
jgi:glucosamine--fructose-6-phosphate aminotransferase (isomerizing)